MQIKHLESSKATALFPIEFQSSLDFDHRVVWSNDGRDTIPGGKAVDITRASQLMIYPRRCELY